ncbi:MULTISPECIES: MauE/DoxX family redox-associated membrane protein [Maribacter]|uniref:MauE/DoxX family redox-associated membrane protein n=1 Tax=Maribacter flavus TaxID=1658664 RepID=A0ABU7IKD9_9FLAO|nr:MULTISPECIES: MauE/DoxX family redox-associated membrane protein [Maribacter]MDC6406312.1 hypothetical protein [Maribacter sp. PR66]MEE1973432.1 MauE/DoxX family redox-associated membrane protein [Maribacter flavus]
MSYKGIHSKFVALFSLLLTVLFVYTAVSKLNHLNIFQLRLERMPYLSPYASLISWGVPFLELVIAGLLWFPKYQKLALCASFTLMGLFTSYIILVLRYSDSIPCSCGGVISSMGWETHLVFNACWMALALIGIVLLENKEKKSSSKNTVQ